MNEEKKNRININTEDSWTDDLEEAIQRQTMKEQQEYAVGEDILPEPEPASHPETGQGGSVNQEQSVRPGRQKDSGQDFRQDLDQSLRQDFGQEPLEDAVPHAEGVPGQRPEGNGSYRRSRNFASPGDAETMKQDWDAPEDAVLFDEVDGGADSSAGKSIFSGKKRAAGKKKEPRREQDRKTDRYRDRDPEPARRADGRRDRDPEPDWRQKGQSTTKRNRKEQDFYRDPDDGGRYDEYDEYDSTRRSGRGGYDRSMDGMSRKERREYEEFLAYKEQKNHRKRKKKHRVRNAVILVLVLIFLVLPVLAIAARVIGITQGVSTQDIRDLLSEEVKKSQETGAMAGYTNIALFGLDSTQQSLDAGNNRTDVMIIASINNKTGDVKLVSLYRDTYLDIGDGNYQKANAAYAFGGPEQAIKMINTNLDLNITDYVTVGFGGVADLVDEVGGVEIDVQSDEIEHLNNYQSTMAVELGKEYVPVTAPGVQTLNGLQATAYCRIRYTDGGDFKRTERQKEVLSKAFEKLKKSGPVTMIKAANSLSSEIRTSLNPAEIAALAMKAFRFNISETSGFPNDQYRTVGYIGDQSCVIPIHLTDNVVWLHQYLFGDTSYQVSQTVQNISNEVSARSGY